MRKTIVLLVFAVALGIFLWRSEDMPTVTVFPAVQTVTPSPSPTPQADPRIASLTAFFTARKCPEVNFSLIIDYLGYADQYNLDYRILPAISVQESSCAEHYPANTSNIWGWDSARTGFASLQAGINFISDQLANGHYYTGKTLEQKLHSYNPNPSYAPRIIGLMKEIQP